MKRVLGLVLALTAVLANVHAKELDLVSNEKLAELYVARVVLAEVYRKAGLSLTVTPLPPARSSSEATGGQRDGEVARIGSYGTRFPTMVQVKPAYYHLTTSVFALQGSKIQVKTVADLAKYRVAVINGVAHSADATAGLEHVERVANAENMFKMLLAGRVDVVLDTGINRAYEIRRLKLANVVEVAVVAKLELFHYLNEKNRALVPLLESTIRSLTASGELQRLVAKAEKEFLSSGVAP